MPNPHLTVGDTDKPGNWDFRISLKLAAILQLVMMAAGAGATYTATRAAIDIDHQRIEEQSRNIQSLQTSMTMVQQTLSSLTTAIDYMNNEIRSMQERIWNDKPNH